MRMASLALERSEGKVVILGAGLAGLSSAYHLDADYEIYEKESEVGGLCRSRSVNGFVFDYAVHGFLEEKDIYPCGRFGMWEYYNMDHAILSGKAAAEKSKTGR